jgi:hypothetical protein
VEDLEGDKRNRVGARLEVLQLCGIPRRFVLFAFGRGSDGELEDVKLRR